MTDRGEPALTSCRRIILQTNRYTPCVVFLHFRIRRAVFTV